MNAPRLAKRAFDTAWFILAITLALAILMVPLAFLTPLPGVLHLGTPISFELALDGHGVAGGLIRDAQGTLSAPAARSPFLFANILALIIALGIALWVVGNLRALLATVCEGRPFVSANVRRIRIVGFAVLLGEAAYVATCVIENTYAKSTLGITGVHIDLLPPVNVRAILCGLFILGLAEVFGVGTRLSEDQSLTI